MNPRFYGPLWVALLVLLAGACGVDSSGRGAGGEGGGQAALTAGAAEKTGEARAALTAGAGSVGDCNGNPARCPPPQNPPVGVGHASPSVSESQRLALSASASRRASSQIPLGNGSSRRS